VDGNTVRRDSKAMKHKHDQAEAVRPGRDFEEILINYPPVDYGPVAVFARQVASHATENEYQAEKGNGQVRSEVNVNDGRHVEHSQDTPYLVRPVQAVVKLQGQEPATGGDCKAVPDVQFGKWDIEQETSEQNTGNPDMSGTQENIECSHPARSPVFVVILFLQGICH
jgi:hypothetical protein